MRTDSIKEGSAKSDHATLVKLDDGLSDTNSLHEALANLVSHEPWAEFHALLVLVAERPVSTQP